MKVVRRERVENKETTGVFRVRRRTENIQEWKEKLMYGKFPRGTEDQRNKETWSWLNERKL